MATICRMATQGLYGCAVTLAALAVLCAPPSEASAALVPVPAFCTCTSDTCALLPSGGCCNGFCNCTDNCGCGTDRLGTAGCEAV